MNARRGPTPTHVKPAQPEPWMNRALCLEVGPDLFFSEPGETGVAALAREVCQLCDVREACLDYALANNESFGVWGGLGPRQRRKLANQQRRTA